MNNNMDTKWGTIIIIYWKVKRSKLFLTVRYPKKYQKTLSNRKLKCNNYLFEIYDSNSRLPKIHILSHVIHEFEVPHTLIYIDQLIPIFLWSSSIILTFREVNMLTSLHRCAFVSLLLI